MFSTPIRKVVLPAVCRLAVAIMFKPALGVVTEPHDRVMSGTNKARRNRSRNKIGSGNAPNLNRRARLLHKTRFKRTRMPSKSMSGRKRRTRSAIRIARAC